MMRSNFVYFMAQQIEEHIRQDHPYFGKIFKYILYPCLADKLCLPFRIVCNNPIISLSVILVVYIIFLALYFPLWILSFVCTSYGSWLILILGFHFLSIFVARSIAFPGSSTSTLKQMSADTIRRLADYMEQTAVASKEIASSMMLLANGKIPKEQLEVNILTLYQIWPAVEYFPQIQIYFDDALEQIQSENILSPEELKTTQLLSSGLGECFTHFKDLLQFSISCRDDRSRSTNIFQNLLILSARCMNSSEKVRTCAHLMKPINGGGDDDMISNVLRSLLSFASGMSGFERLSFPYLRAILKKKHKAEIVQINGPDNNKIDGLIFRSNADPRKKGGVAPNDNTSNDSAGLVIFCSPNAGFYECISQYNFDKSWFGYYLALGFDVFVYNYRGYGRSQGSPTPSFLKNDAMKVLEFIRKEYNPRKIIVHGESIGGMVACHIARYGNVQGLVCDRTFSSLDGAASRLMGNWAGFSMRKLVLWQTDVVDDFINSRCDKLILQDPNDEIIADAASLRAGVASVLVYGQKSNSVPSETPCYAVARYLHTNVPQNQEESSWFLVADDPSQALPQEFVTHFHACCRFILEKAALGGTVSENNLSQISSDDISATTVLQNQLSTIELVQRKGGHAEQGSGHILVADGPVEDTSDIESASTDTDRTGSFRSNSSTTEDEKFHRMNVFVRRRYIDRIVGLSLDNSVSYNIGEDITPYQKCWIAISRVTNSCGQYFGEAIGRGLDSTRTWTASFIVWNHAQTIVEKSDNDESDIMSSIRRSIADLEYLTQVAFVNELRASHELTFIIKAFHVLFKRNQYCFRDMQVNLASSILSSGNIGGGQIPYQFHASVAVESASQAGLSTFNRCVSTRKEILSVDVRDVGKLLPLACGHNGWPDDEYMDRITSWLHSTGVQ